MKVKGSKSRFCCGKNTYPEYCDARLLALIRGRLRDMLLMDQPISGEAMVSKPRSVCIITC